MKKIFILLFGIIISCFFCGNAYAVFGGGDQIIEIGPGPVDPFNLSELNAFVVNPDEEENIILLQRNTTDTYLAYSTKNEVMGACTTKYEVYKIGEGESNTYNIMVLYKATIEPKKDVKYYNGLGNAFTETGDSVSKLFKLKVDFNTIGSALYCASEPQSTIIQYTDTIGISYDYVTSSDGDIYIVPKISYETSTSTSSVIVSNQSSIAQNILDIKWTYTKKDNYSTSTSEQYGFFYFTIPNSYTSFNLKLETLAEFVIAEGSFWGECRDTCGGISVINIVI